MTAAGRRASRDSDRAMLQALQRGRDWIWIAGNHDPEPAADIGGSFAETLALGPLTFRHEPSPHAATARSPAICIRWRVARRGRTISRRCFAGDGRRLVMPAFGAYTGGLNVRDRAFADCSARSPSPPTCWASGGSTRSPRRAAWRIEIGFMMRVGH